MNQFPASSSILSAAHLSTFIKENYGFKGSVNCQLIKAGINHTYLITTIDNKYILRVYSLGWRTTLEILEEIRLLQHLHNSGVSVSFAIADSAGQHIRQLQAAEGLRYAVLFSYASGSKQLDAADDVHYAIGKSMARFHQHAHHFKLQRVRYTPDVLITQALEYLKPFLQADVPEMQFMISTGTFLLEQLATVDNTFVRNGAIHLDMWFDNLVIDTNGNITVFDFDFCGNGWLCTDVAYYLMQLYAMAPNETDYQRKSKSFLDGYESITPLTDTEKRLLPLLGLALHIFYLGEQCRRFENWSNVFINDVYLKRYITVRVKKYFDFHFSIPASREPVQ